MFVPLIEGFVHHDVRRAAAVVGAFGSVFALLQRTQDRCDETEAHDALEKMADEPHAKKEHVLEVTTRSDREIVTTGMFGAPCDLVFEAFTQPALIQRWLLGPDGWSMPVCDVDLRPRGAFRYTWRNDDDGREFGIGGVYREIAPPDVTDLCRNEIGNKKEPRRSAVLRFSPNGIRTRVTAVRGRRPRPLDDRAVWLPGRDSNSDDLSQSQACYRCITREGKRSISREIPPVPRAIRFRLAVTVRAEHSEVVEPVIVADAVPVIELHHQRPAVPFPDPTLLANVS